MTIILKHTRHGCRFDCSCVWQNGLELTQCTGGDVCTTHTMAYVKGQRPPHFPVPALRTETGFKMYYGKDRKPERLVLGIWLIDRLELRYLLYVFRWRVMI